MFHAPQVVISSHNLLGEGETKTFKEVQIKKMSSTDCVKPQGHL